jgi:hypothetical protein
MSRMGVGQQEGESFPEVDPKLPDTLGFGAGPSIQPKSNTNPQRTGGIFSSSAAQGDVTRRGGLDLAGLGVGSDMVLFHAWICRRWGTHSPIEQKGTHSIGVITSRMLTGSSVPAAVHDLGADLP